MARTEAELRERVRVRASLGVAHLGDICGADVRQMLGLAYPPFALSVIIPALFSRHADFPA